MNLLPIRFCSSFCPVLDRYRVRLKLHNVISLMGREATGCVEIRASATSHLYLYLKRVSHHLNKDRLIDKPKGVPPFIHLQVPHEAQYLRKRPYPTACGCNSCTAQQILHHSNSMSVRRVYSNIDILAFISMLPSSVA